MSEKFANNCKPVDHYDENAPIRVWLGNLGLYNEGYLVGEWVSLPATADELAEALQRVGLAEGHNVDEFGTIYEEHIFNDYETDIPGLELHEYGDLESYNEIAEWWTGVNDWERPIIAARLENGATVEELAADPNSTDDANVYEAYSIEDAICQMIEDMGGLETLGRETLERYFDWSAFARDCQLEGDWHEVNVDGSTYQVELY